MVNLLYFVEGFSYVGYWLVLLAVKLKDPFQVLSLFFGNAILICAILHRDIFIVKHKSHIVLTIEFLVSSATWVVKINFALFLDVC